MEPILEMPLHSPGPWLHIEAITPEPQGDVTLEEVKRHLGDMFLLDGIPAIYFDKSYPERLVVDTARRCIDMFTPNLVLGISDEISSRARSSGSGW